MSTHYRLYCTTEAKYIETWASIIPTECPNNSGHTIQTDSITIIEQKLNKIIISQDGQSDFTNITDALTENAGKYNTVFQIYPGTYVETNPIVLPVGCVLSSVGTAGNVVIVGNDPTKDMFYLSSWSKLYGILSVGYATAGCRAVYFNGSYGNGSMTDIQDCIFQNYDIGIEVEQGPDTLLLRSCIITASTASLSKGVYIHSGGLIIANRTMITGVAPYYLYEYGVHCTGLTTKLSLTSGAIYLCTHGLFGEDQPMYEVSLITIRYCVNGITVGSVLPGAIWRLSALNIQDSTTYDLNVLSTSGDINIFSGQLDDAKVYNPNKVNINARYQYVAQNKNVCTTTGDIKYGTVLSPTIVAIGEGRYDNISNYCLSNSNLEVGTWVDNTDAALQTDANNFNLFQAVTAGNCYYIGSPRPILGLRIHISTAVTSIVPINDLIYEYWNGTSWVSFYTLQSYALRPFYTYVNNHCISIADKFNVRFGLTSDTPFATKTLNGLTLNWIRVRIINNIASIPVVEYIKLHCSHIEFGGDGFSEYFGNARTVVALPWKLETSSSVSSLLGNKELFLSKTLSIGKKNNTFAFDALSKIGIGGFLPEDIDISFPIKIRLSFIGDSNTAGDVEWKIDMSHTIVDSDIFDNSIDAPTNPSNNTTTTIITSIPINKKNKEIRETLPVNIYELYVNPKPDDGDQSHLWMNLQRDAQVSNTNDTYPGNIYIVNFEIKYIRWCSGDHLLSF